MNLKKNKKRPLTHHQYLPRLFDINNKSNTDKVNDSPKKQNAARNQYGHTSQYPLKLQQS